MSGIGKLVLYEGYLDGDESRTNTGLLRLSGVTGGVWGVICLSVRMNQENVGI